MSAAAHAIPPFVSLPRDQRRLLERTVVAARIAAERAANAALQRLALDAAEAPDGMAPERRAQRTALRARVSMLSGKDAATPLPERIAAGRPRLVEEIADAFWHRMLFARFLAENGLLAYEGVPVSLADCADLARELGLPDAWAVAADCAARMLPGIFDPGDAVHQVAIAAEDRDALEQLLAELPAAIFTASDSLGWCYQFWQSKRKDEVNASGSKIGAAELSPVTQLFTEDYMVRFLLDNTLGAWWAGKHPESPLLADLAYLRRDETGAPAVGTYPQWPQRVADVTLLDPCCGSGHFLVAAFDLLARMRLEEEPELTPAGAARAVLADNLFGLELDPRCVQIAAFAVALQAWTFGGYQPLPIPHIACTGIAVGGSLEEWKRAVRDVPNAHLAVQTLYDDFVNAPTLGSLIDPTRSQGMALLQHEWPRLTAAIERALAAHAGADPVAAVFDSAAADASRAARLLSRTYTVVATNVPYLSKGKQAEVLREYVERHHKAASADLATTMMDRGLRWLEPGGAMAVVTPENWLTLGSYRRFREQLLETVQFRMLVKLGEEAWQSFGNRGPRALLLTLVNEAPGPDEMMVGMDLSTHRGQIPILVDEKPGRLREGDLAAVPQQAQLQNPDARILLKASAADLPTLSDYAQIWYGSKPGQTPRVVRFFWEIPFLSPELWVRLESTPNSNDVITGKSDICYSRQQVEAHQISEFGYRSTMAWGRQGIIMASMARLTATRYLGHLFDDNSYVVTPNNPEYLVAISAFMSDPAYFEQVRILNQKLRVDLTAAISVPFDLEHWQRVAAERYPDGMPEPFSSDPSQWLFTGLVPGSDDPLQVAVARLLGYRWPEQAADGLDELVDPDGIVCLPAVRMERPAHDRLLDLLARAYGPGDWSPAQLDALLAGAGVPGGSLERWLRDQFFPQHLARFHNRPFLWQIWDGRKDGFSAIVNYHRLDRAALDKLIYSYLGDWIDRQRQATDPQAEARLLAALDLQQRLILIATGEPPHDIFVRWKPAAQQPLGWEPDLNDGVRLNIRPFVEARVLRGKFSINWNKDRGTNPAGAPWGAERHNDRHLTLAEKQAARAAAATTKDATP